MKTQIVKINPFSPDSDKIASCAQVIRRGGLVVFPTETVYGIAADFMNPQAIARLKEVKRRSDGKPFSVMVAQKGIISNYTSLTSTVLYKFIDAYWPGPLTIIVPTKNDGETIGFRMPDHEIALSLVQDSQCLVAAPSANFEGNPAPTTFDEAMRDMDGLVDVAIDGGKSEIGLSSTVLDLSQEKPLVLREGVVTKADVEKISRRKTILFVCTGNSCRSVMAEYLLKSLTRGREDIEIISAGTGVYFASSASAETISVLKDQGIDATRHQSQSVNNVLLKKADLIFALTRAHRQAILERAPDVEKRVYLLREFTKTPPGALVELDIPDPIGSSRQGYQECMQIIREAIFRVADLL